MEEQNLTKADIDKVRHIEGFPIAKDEDIHASGYLKRICLSTDSYILKNPGYIYAENSEH